MECMIIPPKDSFTVEDVRIRTRMRGVYGTSEGKEELINYLNEMGCFSEISPDELPLRNAAVRKMRQLGFLDMETIDATISFLMSRPAATPERMAEKPKEWY